MRLHVSSAAQHKQSTEAVHYLLLKPCANPTLNPAVWLRQAQQREEERVNDIVHRTVEKDEKLATLRDHRDHVNACKSLERKLDLDLKREKVCYPQGHACCAHHVPQPTTLNISKVLGSRPCTLLPAM